MKMKHIAAAAAFFVSGSAFAGATGNVGAFSEYLFRGVEQSNGAAIQGGLDYAHESGAYAGAWMSNVDFATADSDGDGVLDSENSTYETDLYAGFSGKAGALGFDVGAIYYYYRDTTDLNTIEGYVGLSMGPVSGKLYYTPEYFGTDDEGLYVTLSAGLPLSDSLTLTPQVGHSTGDGVDGVFGESYTDYSLTLAKSLEAGMTASFAVVGTDLDNDDEKVVLGLKKTFDL